MFERIVATKNTSFAVELKSDTPLPRTVILARGDVNAVRALVELGEPYKDNHCEHLEAEIVQVARELEAAAKKLRELSALKEQLLPELERLKVGGRRCRSAPFTVRAVPTNIFLYSVVLGSCRRRFFGQEQKCCPIHCVN